MSTIFTAEQIDALIKLPKKIVQGEESLSEITIDQRFPLNERFQLVSDTEDDYSFLWQITQSGKDQLRISLHFMEDESKIGLFRVDYNGAPHTNPLIIKSTLPERFHPLAGAIIKENHIHYFVEGYKPLVWALPIAKTDFGVKEINGTDYWTGFGDAIQEFARIIGVETKITINKLML